MAQQFLIQALQALQKLFLSRFFQSSVSILIVVGTGVAVQQGSVHRGRSQVETRFPKLEEQYKRRMEIKIDRGVLGSTDPECSARLERLHKVALNWASHHSEMMKEIYPYYCANLTMALMSGALGSVGFLMISLKGWQAASPIALMLTFVLLVASASFVASEKVYQFSENFDQNRRLFLQNLQIADSIDTFSATWKENRSRNNGSLSCGAFALAVDSESKSLQNVALLFDSSKVPTATELSSKIRTN